MQIFVVSNIESRRTAYFIKAGISLGADPRFLTYTELLRRLPGMQESVVKLEPFVHDEAKVNAYTDLCEVDRQILMHLEEIGNREQIYFMNTPRAILQALDKVYSKTVLVSTGLRITPLLASNIVNFESLRQVIAECPGGIFLKPRYGSGAAGIMAIRYQPGRDQWVAYTTLQSQGDQVYNTKRIHRLTEVAEICRLSETVLHMGALVEGWIPKDSFRGENYDLRVVCRGDQVDYVVVRYSNGAITNLHLNNKAGRFEELQLTPGLREEIYAMSIAATRALGLYYAGVDILLEKGSRRPCIIEVNGQGDHIYQDMYDENRIYTRQIKALLKPEENR